jgi:anaerobic magnesium-protoporphyrin IX monomethyl ester cyclase
MRVLLFNPPTPDNKKFIREGRCTQEQGVWGTLWPPVSLATTAAVLEQAGHVVRVYDCPAIDMRVSGLLAAAASFAPECVMWSTGTPSISSDLALARDFKRIRPDACTAVFGTHVTVLDRQSLSAQPELDCIIRHEPELTAACLAEALEHGRGPGDVAGITCRGPAGEIRATPGRPFIENLDDLPFPAWHLLDIRPYRLPLKGRPFLIVAPQRGCPFGCSFCTCQAYYGSRLRRRRAARVVDEIEHDLRRWGIRDFFFWAETFVLDREYVASLCHELLARGLGISWTCNSRVDIVDRDLLALMARAGCWMISFGIESADQTILDGAHKGVTVQQAAEAVSAASAAGIKTAGHFIFGLPGETERSMRTTLGFARSLGLDIAQFYCCAAFPGSRLYDQALTAGWLRDAGFSRFSQSSALLQLPTVAPGRVESFRRQAYRRFYLNPGACLRVMRMLGWGGLRDLGRTLKSFLGWSA